MARQQRHNVAETDGPSASGSPENRNREDDEMSYVLIRPRFSYEPVIYGNEAPSTNALGTIPSVVLPSVSEVFPGLTAFGMVYWVARFHTHTTTEYWTSPPPPAQFVRCVGPSPTDLNNVNGIPSAVFDYIESPESYQPQTIQNGWPKSSPAKLYTYGPTQRATP